MGSKEVISEGKELRVSEWKDNIESMRRNVLTVYEAHEKYGFSKGYLRLLLGKGSVKGERAKIKANSFLWLIDKDSLKSFHKTRQRPNRKTK